MTGVAPQATDLPPGGLCLACAHHRVIRSGRGSVFLMCERGLRKETGYMKYPPLPVVACRGYERPSAGEEDQATATPGEGEPQND